MKILYCTDFSEAAQYSLEKALPFLKQGAQFDIISAIEPGYEEIEIYKENKINKLEEARKQLNSMNLNVTKLLSAIGPAADVVIEQIKNNDYDLVISGSRKSFVLKWLGSTSRKIATYSPVPVFIARKTKQEVETKPKKDILFGVDGSENSYNAIKKAIEILELENSTLEIIYVKQGRQSIPVEITYDAEWLQRVLDMQEKTALETIKTAQYIFEKNGFNVCQAVTPEGDPSSEIIEYTEASKKDLLVMGSHGRTGISQFLLGSVSKRVLDNTVCPVLIVPTKKT